MILLLLLTPPTEPPDGEPFAHVKTPKKWPVLAGRIVRAFLLILIGCVAALSGAVVSGYLYFARDLPSIEEVKSSSPPIVSQIYADNGELIGEFASQRRIVVPLDQIPQSLKDAFISAQDRHFFKHKNPAWDNLTDYLIDLRFCRPPRRIAWDTAWSFLPISRRGGWHEFRMKMAILCFHMGRSLSGEQILFLYLNRVRLGNGVYGVEEASRTYFGKSVKDLTVGECAMIVGLARTPARFSLKKDLGEAIERRSYVLKRMLEDGRITRAQFDEAMTEEPRISTRDSAVNRTAPDPHER